MKIPTVCLGKGMQPSVTLDWACWGEPGKKLSITQKRTIEKFLWNSLVCLSCGMFLNRILELLCPRPGFFPSYPTRLLPLSRALTAWHGQGLEGAEHLGSWTWWSNIFVPGTRLGSGPQTWLRPCSALKDLQVRRVLTHKQQESWS